MLAPVLQPSLTLLSFKLWQIKCKHSVGTCVCVWTCHLVYQDEGENHENRDMSGHVHAGMFSAFDPV